MNAAELRAKHLEFLQVTIARMSSFSANTKTFTLTLVTAVVGLAITLQRAEVSVIALPLIIVMGVADAQYLRIERQYRWLFDRVREEDWTAPPSFSMNASSAPSTMLGAVFGWSVWPFYLALLVSVILALCFGDDIDVAKL